MRSQFWLDGLTTGINCESAGNYIRASNGHNEGTTSMRRRWLFTEGQTVGVWGTRGAAAGTVIPYAGFNRFLITKV